MARCRTGLSGGLYISRQGGRKSVKSPHNGCSLPTPGERLRNEGGRRILLQQWRYSYCKAVAGRAGRDLRCNCGGGCREVPDENQPGKDYARQAAERPEGLEQGIRGGVRGPWVGELQGEVSVPGA